MKRLELNTPLRSKNCYLIQYNRLFKRLTWETVKEHSLKKRHLNKCHETYKGKRKNKYRINI